MTKKTPQSSVLARPNNAMAVTRLAYTMVGHGLLPPPGAADSLAKRTTKSLSSVSQSGDGKKEGRKEGIAARSLSNCSAAVSLSPRAFVDGGGCARMRGRRRSGARSECGDVKAPTRQKESKKERNYDRERVRASKDKSESVIENFLA